MKINQFDKIRISGVWEVSRGVLGGEIDHAKKIFSEIYHQNLYDLDDHHQLLLEVRPQRAGTQC